VAAAAGLAAVGILEREDLVQRAARVGADLGRNLAERIGGLPVVADVRGLGMMWGVELVADRKTLAPFPRGFKVAERVAQNLFDSGVIVYRATALAGEDGDGLVIAPPFVIDGNELSTVVEAVGKAIEEALC
jgi:adenosylmethionine-8-amino-7-oxononanoate aminotransferase